MQELTQSYISWVIFKICLSFALSMEPIQQLPIPFSKAVKIIFSIAAAASFSPFLLISLSIKI